MFNWLKKNKYPEFWNNYLKKFEGPKSPRFIIIDIKTSGDSIENDVIQFISTFGVENNSIIVNDSFEVVLKQYIYNKKTGISNDYIIESKCLKLTEAEAIEKVIEQIGNSVLVGYHVNFSIDMINAALERMNLGRLKNDALDIEIIYQKWKEEDHPVSFEEMCTIFNISQFNFEDCTLSAYNIGLIFIKLKSKFGIFMH
ncbi:MAG: 3'-5' exonuclease [Flavobacterium sp.]